MIHFDALRRRLDLSPDDLSLLARHAGGATGDPPAAWSDAGIARDGRLHPVVAAIAVVAVAPDRVIALEVVDGGEIRPVIVGWHRSGRATITEHRVDRPGELSIAASHVELLPALVLQTIGLDPDQPPARRPAIVTTAGALDDLAVGLAAGGVAASLSAPDDLDAVVRATERVVRATGSWSGATSDDSVTLLLAGTEGVWTVGRDDGGDRSSVVRLRPTDLARAAARLGDVVSGRTSPRPAAA